MPTSRLLVLLGVFAASLCAQTRHARPAAAASGGLEIARAGAAVLTP